MNRCKFETDINNPTLHRCIVCGVRIKGAVKAESIYLPCRGPSKYKIPPTIPSENKEPPKKSLPPISKQIKNALWAGIDFLKNPELVTDKLYLERLKVCNTCEERVDNRCSKCGCFLATKAKGAAFSCPLLKWPGEQNFKPIEDTSSEHTQEESPLESQPPQE